LADRLAACLKDQRAPEKVVHRLAEIIRFRMLMIAAGYVGAIRGSRWRETRFQINRDRVGCS
jgi:hypothetical protein